MLQVDVPAAYAAGATYRVTVTVRDTGLRRAGFQLAARFADGVHAGEQAGLLRAVDRRVAVVVGPRDVLYAQHTLAGAGVGRGLDSAAWTLEWVAPAPGGPVVFHVAGNASNGDASEWGDVIRAAAWTVL